MNGVLGKRMDGNIPSGFIMKFPKTSILALNRLYHVPTSKYIQNQTPVISSQMKHMIIGQAAVFLPYKSGSHAVLKEEREAVHLIGHIISAMTSAPVLRVSIQCLTTGTNL